MEIIEQTVITVTPHVDIVKVDGVFIVACYDVVETTTVRIFVG